MTQHRQRDPGLQPERTELAWRRTALSISVGSLVCARLLPEITGDGLTALAGIAGLGFASWLWFAARRRGTRTRGALVDAGSAAMPGASLLLVVGLFSVLSGGVAVLLLIAARAWMG